MCVALLVEEACGKAESVSLVLIQLSSPSSHSCEHQLHDWYHQRVHPDTTIVLSVVLCLHAQDPEDYRNVFFTRQFLGFGLDRKGSAVSATELTFGFESCWIAH